MIDPNRKYRTRGRRAVRIYATDGIGNKPVHGVEVTLADELRDQIPWEALRPHVKWVAMHSGQRWLGFERKPSCSESMQGWIEWSKGCIELDAVSMPLVDTVYWRETLMKRPE